MSQQINNCPKRCESKCRNDNNTAVFLPEDSTKVAPEVYVFLTNVLYKH